MYYKVTKDGLVLDKQHTIEKNKWMFGITNVLTETEFKAIPIGRSNKRKQELQRIMNCK